MITNRLRLALELLKSSDWERFEKLSSIFLATDFSDLRTVASPSGDGGRDSELFSPHGEPRVLLQYSVTPQWSDKIRRTIDRVKETFPDSLMLVFVSSYPIGALADEIKRAARVNHGLTLDVRDRTWFIDRVLGSSACEQAAEELAQATVDPYLAKNEETTHVPSELSSQEAIAAVTFLGLQWQDDVREKGLTKLAFEALVRAVLKDTNSESRMSRTTILQSVSNLLPGHGISAIGSQVDKALQRLTKKAIRHWPKGDEFCLTFEEVERVKDFRTKAALAGRDLLGVISAISTGVLAGQSKLASDESQLTKSIRDAIDEVLFERSQAFSLALRSGSLSVFAESDFNRVLTKVISSSTLPKRKGVDWLRFIAIGVREILLSEEPAVQMHLRSLADSYTLLAFLRQTPDVQEVVEKLFSHGQIWLDTSVILPLFAEPLFEASPGRFTRMVSAARDAGLELFVTEGVIEEIERHMNRGHACTLAEHGTWQGRIPYLLERYILSGRARTGFAGWLEKFRGTTRPMDDIAIFLREEFHIETRSLEQERDTTDAALRDALQALWYEAHQRRRTKHGNQADQTAITRLVEHDVECYCGVVALRSNERASPFGYSAWWLTVDTEAFDLKPKLREIMRGEPPDSPVLSADFLVNYLAFGPMRRKIDKVSEARLPLLLELGSARYLTPELLTEADSLRDELRGLSDRVIRRRVRDHLDRARQRLGPIARAGQSGGDDLIAI